MKVLAIDPIDPAVEQTPSQADRLVGQRADEPAFDRRPQASRRQVLTRSIAAAAALSSVALGGCSLLRPATVTGPRADQALPATTGIPGRLVDIGPTLDWSPLTRRRVRVWLPQGYDRSTDRYRVIYMHDGQALFEPSDSLDRNAWDVDRTLACLIAQNDVFPTLVVAIDNATIDRAREFTPQAPLMALGEPLRKIIPRVGTAGSTDLRSDAYVAMLVNRIKPRVDREFRTRPGRDDTVVMGSSLGGLISLYALCQQPQIFGTAACLSTHWPITTNATLLAPLIDSRVELIAESFRSWLREKLPRPGAHRFYFDHGTVELDSLYPPHQLKVDALMRELGYRSQVDWTTRRFPGAAHNETAWRARLDVPMRFVLREARVA